MEEHAHIGQSVLSAHHQLNEIFEDYDIVTYIYLPGAM